MITAPTQVRALAKAVATAFAAATLTDEERHPPRIHHTDLPWNCPPLITGLVLENGALQDYLDVPLSLDADKLMRFWSETLRQMWFEPSRVLKGGVYANLSQAMPKVKTGQRALRFSAPAGAPSQIDHTAAVMLSLEVAHTALVSLPMYGLIENDDSYVAIDTEGRRFGVWKGRPIIESSWEFDASGMVPELLRAPRGETSYACHHDQIAAVRSVLYEHPGRFPHNFDALDQALQALRYLALGGYCPELTTAMVQQPMDVMRLKEVEAILFDAIDTIRSNITDRAKLETLRATLVPTVFSISRFKSTVFSAAQFPFSMAPGKTEQIEENLVAAYKSEIPKGLQRPVERDAS